MKLILIVLPSFALFVVDTPDQPLECGLIPHFGHVKTKEGCVTTLRQAINKCSGGCGSVTGQCCYPSKLRNIFAEVKCPDNKVKREQVSRTIVPYAEVHMSLCLIIDLGINVLDISIKDATF